MKTLLERFRELPDYRKFKQLKFNVGEVMYMSLLAILSGANGYMDMELWIKSKKDELTRLLGHRFIAPADNTIRNVYLNMNLEALNRMFEDWSHEIARRDGLSSLNIVSSDEKSNEIPALLELLDSLKLDNCVITVGALHTQKNSKKNKS